MRSLRWILACAVGALSLTGVGHAADNGVYAGASLGQAKTDLSGGLDSVLDGKDTAFKLIVGLRPLDWLGVELSYVDLGEVTQRSGSALGNRDFRFDEAGFDAFGVLFYDIAMVDLFAKGGFIRWDTQSSVRTFFGRSISDDQGTDLAYGVGAQARFGSLAARLEYEHFDIDVPSGFDAPDLISLGVTWTFF
jgi:hypothetical protein